MQYKSARELHVIMNFLFGLMTSITFHKYSIQLNNLLSIQDLFSLYAIESIFCKYILEPILVDCLFKTHEIHGIVYLISWLEDFEKQFITQHQGCKFNIMCI